MSDAPQAPIGLACPRCGYRDLRVRNTVRLPNGTVRCYRVCPYCGTRNVFEVKRP